MSIKIGVSSLTNKIYAGKVRKNKTMPDTWISKDDVTDQAIASVFEWLKSECIKGGTDLFELKYPSQKGKIIFD